jgi:hypothetical protein
MKGAGWRIAAALAAILPGIAAADEPSGCAAFKWPLDHERVALVVSAKPTVANGGTLAYEAATTLKLAPLAEASLPRSPERAPRAADSFAGHFTLPPPAKPGVYKVTMTTEGWVDVLDKGQFVRSKGFTGAVGCDGVRKSVKFELPARSVDLQVSGVRNSEISLIVSPD